MAREASVRINLQIRKGNFDHSTRPTSFYMDITNAKGPTPGAIAVPTYGVEIDLSQLTSPGLCMMYNQDTTHSIEYGLYDPETNKFYPIGMLGPGHINLITLSPNMLSEYAGTGTSTSAPTNKFWAMANGGTAILNVFAFDR